MKEIRMDRRTRYTRKALQDSLIDLMQEKTLSKITIKELCENADINRTTFYAHYVDQYDLLRNIEDEALEWCREILTSFSVRPVESEIISNLERMFNHFNDSINHMKVLMGEQGDILFQQKLVTMIYEEFGILPAGAGSEVQNKRLYFVFVVNGSIGLIQHWLKNGLRESSKEIAETICNMAMYIMK